MDGWRVIWSAQKKLTKGWRIDTKITLPRNGRHKNHSPKGWTDGKLNGWHENNSPKRWMASKYLAKEMDGGRVKWLAEE